ncbi:hypothetical protein AWC15_05125 [Mycobacterium lacus]|uniref:hypothetical protein n=1 Tax=Mycobacterium lacus TaxID=169765 RepID=UPI000A1645D7|nr:hypothetical protein [Mycobacterium lacus]MCV7125821.1 hypothetical protein [Mycobacterium lacus]ORW03543.1 hypothetical protein AWC15_05125 [Mycobacterium lacus]
MRLLPGRHSTAYDSRHHRVDIPCGPPGSPAYGAETSATRAAQHEDLVGRNVAATPQGTTGE